MKILTSFFAFLLLILSNCVLSEERNNSLKKIIALNKKAEQLFIDNNTELAIKAYRKVDKLIQEKYKKYICSYQYQFLQHDIVREYEKVRDVKPQVTYNIFVVFVKTIEVPKHQVKDELTNQEIISTHNTLEIFKKYIKVLTNGQMTININSLVIENKLTQVEKISYRKDYQFYQSDIESLKPFPSQLLEDIYKKNDTIIFYYPSGSIKTRANGEIYKFPIKNYQLYFPIRGIIRIPIEINNACTLVHEFFHVIEDTYKIRPRHGYREENRLNFPEWKGQGQWDFYRWLIEARVFKQGYDLMTLSKLNFYDGESSDILNIKNNIEIYKEERLIEAHKLFRRVFKREKEKRSDRKKQLIKALEYNPDHTGVLARLAKYEYFDKNYIQSKKYIEKAYSINPSNTDVLLFMATLSYRNGEKNRTLELLKQAIKLEQSNSSAYLFLGNIYYEQREYQKALHFYSKAEKFEPSISKKIKSKLKVIQKFKIE